jgi:hypothetical protein
MKEAWRKAAEYGASIEDEYGPIGDIPEFQEVLKLARSLDPQK